MKSFQCNHLSRWEIAKIHAKFAESDAENFNIWSPCHPDGVETWESRIFLNIFVLPPASLGLALACLSETAVHEDM
jgi:hypothetical protein